MAENVERHEERALLLWYASDTLAVNEASAVETHLRGCESCRTELDEIRRLKTAVQAAIGTRPAPSADLFGRVVARVRASESRPASLRDRLTAWSSQVAAWPSILLAPRLAPALALGIIVLQLGLLTMLGTQLYQTTHRGITTQSGPEHTQRPSDSIRLRVAFQDGATALAIRVALEETSARLVDGPSAAGFYIVALPSGAAGRRGAEMLQANTAVVRFVEEIQSR